MQYTIGLADSGQCFNFLFSQIFLDVLLHGCFMRAKLQNKLQWPLKTRLLLSYDILGRRFGTDRTDVPICSMWITTAVANGLFRILSWWRHQMETFSASLALCAWNSPVNSPHKGQWRGALMFSSIWAWINGWVNAWMSYCIPLFYVGVIDYACWVPGNISHLHLWWPQCLCASFRCKITRKLGIFIYNLLATLYEHVISI